ncbi:MULTISPECIES: spore coat U domain-containing protein [unclassified Rickettsia]|jgi:spore coat protein U-like protein|uniref:spore coat protein U domain-containing protein n=1 Tax=unclassified Rickettsia TaxID=114295 RepID=UPI0020A0697C|nr:spore coat U domain-containing protein [Rickettsia endosymbiont of Ceutorhynchus assimilis]
MRIVKLIIFICINLSLISNSFAVCTATIPTVAFGNFAPFANTPTPITINMSVTCTGLVGLLLNYSVGFSTGSSGTFTPRQMKSGIKTLNYNLYKDNPRTQILNLTNIVVTGSFTLIIGSGTNNHTIYATLPAQPLAQAGSYTDTITATVTY